MFANFLKKFVLVKQQKPARKPAPNLVKKQRPPQPHRPRPQERKEKDRLVKLLEDIHRRETELEGRVKLLDRKEIYLQQKDEQIKKTEARLKRQQQTLLQKQAELETKLEKLAHLSSQQAKQEVIQRTEKEMASWIAKKIREAREQIRSQENELSQEILAEALRHGLTDFVAEYTISTIPLKDENIKGKIIGREGRNIRALERATGVDLDLDEEGEIRISSFDSIRREVARIALQKLIRDGRIQPSRIEELVAQTRAQMDKILLEEGKKIAQEAGVYHLPVEILQMLGRYKYRFSYGQNLAVHTLEVVKIGVALARELKADAKTTRIACLLHDIGKVIPQGEGGHVQVGIDFLKRFNLPQPILNAIAEHHEDQEFSSLESVIVWMADAASASRPGARYQAYENYVKRLTDIEEKIKQVKGIADVAIYQAGREIRVLVKPEEISDDELTILLQQLAEKLDDEAKWAGKMKVVAIRETRASATLPLRRSERQRTRS